MTLQESNKNILSMIFIPLAFVLIMAVYIFSNSGVQQEAPTPEYIVGIASIIVVSITAIVCLVTAAVAAQPRYHW